jgi:hypothetical protein
MYGEGVMEVMSVKINKRFRAVKDIFLTSSGDQMATIVGLHRRFV